MEEVDSNCKMCGANLEEEDHISDFNNHGGNVSEELIIGYRCHSCGYKHEY